MSLNEANEILGIFNTNFDVDFYLTERFFGIQEKLEEKRREKEGNKQLDYECYYIKTLIRMANDHRRIENHAVRFMSIIIAYKWYLYTVRRRVRCLAVPPTQFHHFHKTLKCFVSSNERLISLHPPLSHPFRLSQSFFTQMLNLRKEKKTVNLWTCNKLASKTIFGWTRVCGSLFFSLLFVLLSSGC